MDKGTDGRDRYNNEVKEKKKSQRGGREMGAYMDRKGDDGGSRGRIGIGHQPRVGRQGGIA